MGVKHPVTAGAVAGCLEISVTFPFEYIKTQLQLQQEASQLFAGADKFRNSFHCASVTMREHGFLGLYRGGASWFLFAGPRSAVRFGTFEALSSAATRNGLPERYGQSAVDTANGFTAGIVEAALCQTPNQVMAIKLIHDQSPRGPKLYTGLGHCVASIWRADGLGGFFQGVLPAVAKGAATNAIRFLGYGQLKRLMQGPPPADGRPLPPLAPWKAMLAGGTAGVVSAVLTQPIDTVKANMMGLEAKRFSSSFACCAEIVRAGGLAALMNGVGPRVVRGTVRPAIELRTSVLALLLLTMSRVRSLVRAVFIEVGLQFSLFESVGRLIDRTLDNDSAK